MWWRDFHSVGGTYLTILVLLFLATALMITLASGTIFALTRVVLRQTTPSVPVSLESIPAAGETPIALQELVAIAQENNLGQSYMISLPANPGAFFTISADNGMAKPELRQNISVDQYSGKIVHTTRWKEYPFLTKLTVWGLSFHFGDLFGITNLVLGILACLALIFFTISGVVMWWKRRPANTWGLPRAVEGGLLTPFPKGLTALIVVLCVLQPTLGISLLIALGVDWLVLRLVKKRTKNAGAAGEDAKTPGVKGKI
jgi:uncharacterized iron-regulated membrane protein